MANKQFLDKQGLTYFYDQLKERLVGKKTTEGGEIFNDYVNNKATAEFATTFGSKNATKGSYSIAAGNLNVIEENAIESMTIGDYNYITANSSFVAGANNYCGGGNQIMAGFCNYVDAKNDNTNGFIGGSGNFAKGGITYGEGIVNYGGSALGVGSYPLYLRIDRSASSSMNKSSKTFNLVFNKTGNQNIKPGWFMAMKNQVFKVASCTYESTTNTHTIVVEEEPKFDTLFNPFDEFDSNSKFYVVFNRGDYYIEGACNFATGMSNQIFNADGYVSGTTGRATCNFIAGNYNKIQNGAYCSSTIGGHLETTNSYENAFGYYNKSTKGKTLFSIGNGTSNSKRKNAFEVKQDGTILVQEPGTANSVNLYDKIKSVDTLTEWKSNAEEAENYIAFITPNATSTTVRLDAEKYNPGTFSSTNSQDTIIPAATTSTAGVMTALDKTKVSNINYFNIKNGQSYIWPLEEFKQSTIGKGLTILIDGEYNKQVGYCWSFGSHFDLELYFSGYISHNDQQNGIFTPVKTSDFFDKAYIAFNVDPDETTKIFGISSTGCYKYDPTSLPANIIKGIIVVSLEDTVVIKGVYNSIGEAIQHSITSTSLTSTGFTLDNIPLFLQPSTLNKVGQVKIDSCSGGNWMDGDGFIDVQAQGRFVSSKTSLKIALKPNSNTTQSGLIITIYNI